MQTGACCRSLYGVLKVLPHSSSRRIYGHIHIVLYLFILDEEEVHLKKNPPEMIEETCPNHIITICWVCGLLSVCFYTE